MISDWCYKWYNGELKFPCLSPSSVAGGCLALGETIVMIHGQEW